MSESTCEHNWYIFEKKCFGRFYYCEHYSPEMDWLVMQEKRNGGGESILVKAVCLKCGERIDDFERIKKAEEAARIAKERYGLALKMWANGE